MDMEATLSAQEASYDSREWSTGKKRSIKEMSIPARFASTPLSVSLAQRRLPTDLSSVSEGPGSAAEAMSGVEWHDDKCTAPRSTYPHSSIIHSIMSEEEESSESSEDDCKEEEEASESSEDDYNEDDPTYYPTDDPDLTVIDDDADLEDIIYLEDEQLGAEDDGEQLQDEEADEDDITQYRSVHRVTKAEEVVGTLACIAYSTELLVLADLQPPSVCIKKSCRKKVTVTSSKVGTALLLKWNCAEGHTSMQWSSQPKLDARGLYAGDFLLAVNVLLSGNNYRKTELLLKFMNIGMVNKKAFHNISHKYSAPQIQSFWQDLQNKNIEKAKEQLEGVVVFGDARMDSPGHTAACCTYTLMEYTTKDILSVVVVDKRETELKSPNMEREGLKRALKELADKGVKVKELVTDGHPSIAKMMRKENDHILHQNDVWHGAKNLTKKFHKVAKAKANKALLPWSRSVINHFWHSSKTCSSDRNIFLAMWISILNHIVNKHSWALGECAHEEIDEDARKALQAAGGKDAPPPWLEPDSAPHIALRNLVLDKRFLNKLGYFKNYRHTGVLETFHNLILMYAAKRFYFTPIMYKARNQLAAIDYTMHQDLPILKKPGSTETQNRPRFSKATGKWTTAPVKQAKQYTYIPELQSAIITTHLQTAEPLGTRRSLPEGDPRRISRTLTNIPHPPTHILAEMKAEHSRHLHVTQ